MADDKSKQGSGDRQRVAGGEGYEISYFAREHGLTKQAATDLISRVGNDRAKLNEAASNTRKG
jgi:hypothetical protein